MESFDAIVDRIETDREHGANFLSQEALRALRLCAESGPPGDPLIKRIRQLSRRLSRARPAMAAIGNVAVRFEGLLRTGRAEETVHAYEIISDFLANAPLKAAEHASRLLTEGSVMTCSDSSTVARALIMATARAKRLRVLAMKSLYGGVCYGERLARLLNAAKVSVKIIDDDLRDAEARSVRAVLIGADRLLPDGTVINGFPSAMLAQWAVGKVPLYVVCDSFKLADDLKIEPGFEMVLPKLIAAIVTEDGVITRDQSRRRFEIR